MDNPDSPKPIPVTNMLQWAEKLKKVEKNPFIASKRSMPDYAKCVGGGIAGASLTALSIYFLNSKIDSKWRLAFPLAGAAVSTLLPSHCVSAGVAGAMYYDLLNELYKKFVK